MNKRQVLRIDFFVQAALFVLTIGAIAWSWFFGQLSSWALLLVLLFVIWQFFSGIYMAAEYKMWHRGVPPGTFLVLITVAILLAALGIDAILGVIVLLVVPLILLCNLILVAIDWYRLEYNQKSNRWGTDKILDADDVFR